MGTEREERLARNEAVFRAANERRVDWEETERDPKAVERFFCECAVLECRQQILVPIGEYERARQDPCLFLITPGHEIPDIESIVEEHDGFVVIRKEAGATDVVVETDPRR